MRVFGLSVLIAVSVVALEAFAVAQTNPPPQDYQQPPPGYQQQPPPGYAPPPGYQQPPPGYQQQPPPGYQQPPPQTYGYPSQPGYAPPPPPGKHGFLALPYIGFQTHQEAAATDLGTGFMLGTLLGGRVNPSFSINGELRIDVLNLKNPPAGYDTTAVEIDLAFSPLFHVPFQMGEFVVGPKLGVFAGAASSTYGGADAGSSSTSGLMGGVNTGVFFNISPSVALGGMLSFTVRDPGEACSTPPGGTQSCVSGDYTSEKIIGFHGGALF